VGTLFDVVVGFGVSDAFLKFLFKDFSEDFTSFGGEKLIEIVKYLSEGGRVHDVIAVVEQGFKLIVKSGVNVGCRGLGWHKNLLVKLPILPKATTPL
jgi:hypothetical protein